MRLLILILVFFTHNHLSACEEQNTHTNEMIEYNQLADEVLGCLSHWKSGDTICANWTYIAPETVRKVLDRMDLSSLKYVNGEKERGGLIRLDFRGAGGVTAHIKTNESNVIYLSIPVY